MSYPKVYRDIFESEGAGPQFRSDRIPQIKEAGIADGAVTPAKLSQSYLPTAGGKLPGAGVKIQFENGDIFVDINDDFNELMFRALGGGGLFLRSGSSAKLPGSFTLAAEGSSGTKYLDGLASGELLWGNKPVISVVESWRDGANWFRKYSDGWIEQGGFTPSREWVTLNTPFASAEYTVVGQTIIYETSTVGFAQIGYRETTRFYIQTRGTDNKLYNDNSVWYACGY